jgi:hypothetical protein
MRKNRKTFVSLSIGGRLIRRGGEVARTPFSSHTRGQTYDLQEHRALWRLRTGRAGGCHTSPAAQVTIERSAVIEAAPNGMTGANFELGLANVADVAA